MLCPLKLQFWNVSARCWFGMYFTPCWFNVQQTTLMGCKEQPEILVPWTTCFLGYAAAFTLLSLICDLSSDELHNLHLLKFLLLSLTRFSFAGSRNSHAIRRQILPVYSFSFFFISTYFVYIGVFLTCISMHHMYAWYSRIRSFPYFEQNRVASLR